MNLELVRRIVRYGSLAVACVLSVIELGDFQTFVGALSPGALAAVLGSIGAINIVLSVLRQLGIIVGPPTPPAPPADPS